ncbi:MAG: hypothetical protein ACTSXQ_06030 [Alphaproteobacteria bacterium]
MAFIKTEQGKVTTFSRWDKFEGSEPADETSVKVQQFLEKAEPYDWKIKRKAPIEWQLDENGELIRDEAGLKIKVGGGYGTLEQQLEIMGEQGITKFRTHISEVKSRISKT